MHIAGMLCIRIVRKAGGEQTSLNHVTTGRHTVAPDTMIGCSGDPTTSGLRGTVLQDICPSIVNRHSALKVYEVGLLCPMVAEHVCTLLRKILVPRKANRNQNTTQRGGSRSNSHLEMRPNARVKKARLPTRRLLTMFFADEDVPGFDVPVNDAPSVDEFQGGH